MLLKDIQVHVKQSNTVEKLIYLTVAVYVINILFTKFMMTWFALSSDPVDLLGKPWTLLSYAFLHIRLFHVLSNLIILYYIGNLFLDFFSENKVLIYYIVGLLTGGILFIGYYYFTKKIENTSLIGASAGAMAVLVGVAAKTPHYALKLRLIGSVELWVLATIFVAFSALGVAGVNAGAGIAHLGGAVVGYLLTVYFKEGNSIEKFINFRNNPKNNPFQEIYKNEKSNLKSTKSHAKKKSNQRKIDTILDKISKSGYDALTKEEKEFLFNQKEE